MFDSFGPGTGFAGGMAFGQITQNLLQGSGSYGEWSSAAMEVATSAQASYRHHLEDTDEPNIQELARNLDMLGREAQRLAVIAENRNFGEEETELMRRLDKLCLRYTNGAPNTDKDPQELLHDELPALVSEIFELLDTDRQSQ